MGDVFEYLVDGMSGLAPGGVEGSAIICGCCSLGEVGKGYLLGKRSDLKALLGIGPLVDRLHDVFAQGGQNPIVIAVPTAGSSGSYIGQPKQNGPGPKAVTSGLAASAAQVIAEVTMGGANGTAEVKISTDGGENFDFPIQVPTSGKLVVQGTGAQITFAGTDVKPLEAGTTYTFPVVTATSQFKQNGPGPEIKILGEPKAESALRLQIVKAGPLNTATYKISVDGDNFSTAKTMPIDGEINVPLVGIKLQLETGEYAAGTEYAWELLAPSPTIFQVMEALETPLELYDIEFIYICGPSDSVAWSAAHAKAQELWNQHRPTYFKFEARLPHVGEDLSEWTAALLKERSETASYFVQVCASFGEVSDSTGLSQLRNLGALQAGRTIANPVQRAAGRVRDGAIAQAKLPAGWNENIQAQLENAGFVTAKTYAGQKGVYFGDSKTLADSTSDFQFEEPLRTTFKALRKCRQAALKSTYDELGDPKTPESAAGLSYLKSNLETALGTMTQAVPQEMAGYLVDIPLDQDFVNNGVAVELTLIGLPIIREIKLFGRYVYAGSKFDPRLEVQA